MKGLLAKNKELENLEIVLAVFEREFRSSKKFNINFPSIGTVNIRIPNRSIIEYIKRIFYGFEIVDYFDGKSSFEVRILNNSKLLPLVRDLLGGNGYGKIANFEFLVSSKFISLARSTAMGTVIYNLGLNPNFGLSSTLRRLLLEGYKKTFPDFVPFHAAAMAKFSSGSKNEAVVFSSPGGQEGVGKGKTTILLLNLLNRKRDFAYVSNDDFLLNPNIKEKRVDFLNLPAEILVRKEVLATIGARKENQEKYINSDGSALLSVHNLKRMGIGVTPVISKIKYWIFIDLRFNKDKCFLQRIPRQFAEKLFVRSIHTGRLNDLKLPLVFGEGNQHLESYSIYSNRGITRRAKIIFKQLFETGTEFYTLEGGLNQSEAAAVSRKLAF